MDIISIFIGLVAGLVLAYLTFTLLHKAKNVSRTTYDALTTRFNETHTQIKVTEERLLLLQQTYESLNTKYELRAQDITGLQSKATTLETRIQNEEHRNEELKKSLSDQHALNRTLQEEINALNQHLATEKATTGSLTERINAQKEINTLQSDDLNQVKEQLVKLTERNLLFSSDNSRLTANNAALNEKLSVQKTDMLELQKTAHLQFEKIAGQILEEKSGKFTEANKANIEALLKPLSENIDQFKKKVEETYDKESKQRFSLEEKVKELVEQTNKVSSEANNLATALKGQAKKQGNWGEMILESILQQSGLVKDREYFVQPTIKDEDGRNLRPDVLVKLPDNRIIIIDSKVSLVAYDRFSSADTTEEQAIYRADHLKSIYSHIDDLHSKKYDHLEASLDFTMMFVPIEPAYLVSIQADPELWAYAYAKRILLISPTNLIACLKLMSDLWKREMQSKNAMEIVKRGELMYEKFVTFVSTLEDLGKHINRTQQSYTAAIGQLNTGSGNLVGQALKLKELGLKSSKQIPAALLPEDFEPEPTIQEPQPDGQ
ncbi:DNA recombination protein RmuC [Taibaiella sp. KBW10]|uniref:DNA recombination protein RmuC n=1 Tax=Taibaiella sp. KBW10 TaxID=2153357 RepID=UPI000F5AD7F2|nr:DNA recombination protein RmuC [Taibaiella sp. KBW10]RQO29842.1 DNA recombination protein RmuC [Taibaiella sp. KBW10]